MSLFESGCVAVVALGYSCGTAFNSHAVSDRCVAQNEKVGASHRSLPHVVRHAAHQQFPELSRARFDISMHSNVILLGPSIARVASTTDGQARARWSFGSAAEIRPLIDRINRRQVGSRCFLVCGVQSSDSVCATGWSADQRYTNSEVLLSAPL